MNIFRAKIKKHKPPEYMLPDNEPFITFYYDEDRRAVIREIQRYYKKNGFSYTAKGHCFSCADLVLTEETPTGEVLTVTPYHELFDIDGNMKKS